MTLEPDSPDALADCIRAAPHCLAVGAGTKPNLAATAPEKFRRVSTRRLTGIVDYEPSEFTVTVRAGTPVAEIESVLAAEGQYLPFDPPLARAGATIGGTVAAGLSGSGACRFGPIRDFLIGVRFVDGEGRLVTGGGKVVKNAAGFDLPKFLIGSLGRLGALAELTFKVFPKPEASVTFAIQRMAPFNAARLLNRIGRSSLDLDAMACDPEGEILWGRLAGNESALEKRLERVRSEIQREYEFTVTTPEAGARFWESLREFTWLPPKSPLVKIPIPIGGGAEIEPLKGTRFDHLWPHPGPRFYDLGGNVIWATTASELEKFLQIRNFTGLILRGHGESAHSLWFGAPRPETAIARALKHALDPHDRFPPLT